MDNYKASNVIPGDYNWGQKKFTQEAA